MASHQSPEATAVRRRTSRKPRFILGWAPWVSPKLSPADSVRQFTVWWVRLCYAGQVVVSPARAVVVISVACAVQAFGALAAPESSSGSGVPAFTRAGAHQVGGGVARDGGLSRPAQWLLFGAVSFSLALGALSYAFRRPAPRPKTTRRRPAFELLSKLGGTENPVQTLNPLPRRVCPACGLVYRENVRFCGRDGAPLMLVTPNH
jgi:hypothetical protein